MTCNTCKDHCYLLTAPSTCSAGGERVTCPVCAPKVASDTTTIAFVQEWLMSSDHDPTQWDREFAAAIDARCKVASDTGAGLRSALRASLAKRSVPTMDPPWSKAFNAALDMVARDVAPFLATDATDGRAWKPHRDYAGEPMREGEFRDPTDATDGATGGGEVEHLKDVIYRYQCRAGLAAEDASADAEGIAEAYFVTTPGGDLLEQAAREKVEWLFDQAFADGISAAKSGDDSILAGSSSAYAQAAIRALSARNQNDGGGEK